MIDNVNQWATGITDNKNQNNTFNSVITRLISRIEQLEHTTTSLLTGLREHIATIILLMRDIKPNEMKNEETWRDIIARCKLTKDTTKHITNNNCELEKCMLHQTTPESRSKIGKNQGTDQERINNIEFDLTNNEMGDLKDYIWQHKTEKNSEQIEEDTNPS